MNENKPVTAEEIIRKTGDRHENSWDGWYYSEDSVIDAMEEYATLKTQQLTAENERLRKANQNLFEDCQIITEKYTDMVAENERLREVFEELLQSRYADVDPPNKKSRLDYWRTKAGINLTHKD